MSSGTVIGNGDALNERKKKENICPHDGYVLLEETLEYVQ